MEADDFDVSMRAGARAGRRKNIRPPLCGHFHSRRQLATTGAIKDDCAFLAGC